MGVMANEVVRVDLVGDISSTEDWVTTYQFINALSDVQSDADVLDDLESLLEAIATLISALLSAVVIIRRIRVQNLSTGLLVGERSFTTPIQGQVTGDSGPFNAAAVINFPTNVPRVIGRKYFGPVGEASMGVTGALTSTARTALEAVGDALVANHVESNTNWRYGYLSPKTQSFELFTTHNEGVVLGTRRSRKLGVGS